MILTNRDRSHHRIAAACLIAAAATGGCSTEQGHSRGGGPHKLARPAAESPGLAVAGHGGPTAQAAPAPQAVDPAELEAAAKAAQADAAAKQQADAQAKAAARAEAAKRWGVAKTPLAAPPPPATKPALAPGAPGVKIRPGLPPVVYRVPTTDKVVFLTVDDGAEKDREFTRMIRELGIPISAFVTDYLARGDYGYFRELKDQGVAINNHTLHHPDLRRLGDDAQQSEICGQQASLQQQIGVRPRLFRPPFGEYTEESLRIAGSCGVTAVPLWNEEAFPDRMEYRYGDHLLKPGDIILTHFRGPDVWRGDMRDMLRRVLQVVTDQGFALARLDDYL
ncbi:polysaccharide deacetylase family protein [Yinghuangia seranimata]|uniref:polysaccharide deacetylase family protein n=1 Tax=Yinghuangia seranimata TaxID=408067 RepID=UPI00248BB166|nr:polysaccharide deacetylase family protein [Yinghuangia seranimata]MDI2129773.1 polysaccharide deacetylase family protein [Yinghuangia seranimata]